MLKSTIFKITIIISILGTFSILLISEFSEIRLQKISELEEDQLEVKVRVQGKLLAIKETPGLYILTLAENKATIPIIIFKEDELKLKKNSELVVQGRLTEYRDNFEIIAERIIELKND